MPFFRINRIGRGCDQSKCVCIFAFEEHLNQNLIEEKYSVSFSEGEDDQKFFYPPRSENPISSCQKGNGNN